MISRLRGIPAGHTTDGVVLDVNGVGYLLHATPSAQRLAQSGGEVVLETYLHVRDDALQLYGFAEPAERELFEHLLSVSGVGPKVALAIVSGSTPGSSAARSRWRTPRASRRSPGSARRRRSGSCWS